VRPLLVLAVVALAACHDAAPTGPVVYVDGETVVVRERPAVLPGPPPGGFVDILADSRRVGVTDDGRFRHEIEIRLVERGVPVVGEVVAFSVTRGPGELSASAVATDASGYARSVVTLPLAEEVVVAAATERTRTSTTTIVVRCTAAPARRTLPCPPTR